MKHHTLKTGIVSALMAWENSKVTHYRIRSKEPREVTVRVNGEVRKVQPELMK